MLKNQEFGDKNPPHALYFESMKTRKYLFVIALFAGGLLLGALGSYFLTRAHFASALEMIQPIHEEGTSYHYINPLLACDIPQSASEGEYLTLKKHINTLILNEQSNGSAKNISVYVKDLTQGQWVGINENAQYYPASLMKAVLMIAYFRELRANPSALNEQLRYTTDIAKTIATLPLEATSSIAVNETFSVEVLLKKMVIDSDNVAMYILLNNIKPNILSGVYEELGIKSPDANPETYEISAKDYSLFFRVLYNSTYLGRKNSERALGILAETNFTDGLRLGVPQNIEIAHKYGVRAATAPDGVPIDPELHDCGIVYAPGRPYFLCVMTRGATLTGLKQTIGDISALVYGELSGK